jgi:hypothetical protein
MSKKDDTKQSKHPELAADAVESQSQQAEASETEAPRSMDDLSNGEAVFFSGTVVKVDKDGNEVMSDHLLPGEKLRREVTGRYASSPTDDRREVRDNK